MKYEPVHYRVVAVQYHCPNPEGPIEECRTEVEQGEFVGNLDDAYYEFPQEILDRAEKLAGEGYDTVWVEIATPTQVHWNHWRKAYGYNVKGAVWNF